jgi:hypothetical protein
MPAGGITAMNGGRLPAAMRGSAYDGRSTPSTYWYGEPGNPCRRYTTGYRRAGS